MQRHLSKEVKLLKEEDNGRGSVRLGFVLILVLGNILGFKKTLNRMNLWLDLIFLVFLLFSRSGFTFIRFSDPSSFRQTN